MAKKTVWLTWLALGDDAVPPQPAVATLDQAGFDVAGAPWIDAPDDFAWCELARHLAEDTRPDVWVIGAGAAELGELRHRFALAMAVENVRTDCNPVPLVVLAGIDGAPDPETLPTALRSCTLVDGSGTSWGTKVLVATAKPAAAPREPFRLRAIAQKMFGMWFEVGPTEIGGSGGASWDGAMFGVAGDAKILEHAVGPRGVLPERTVLEYKLEGLELEVGDRTFVANAVKNAIDAESSYYVKIDGTPEHLLIGQHPDADPEVSIVSF